MVITGVGHPTLMDMGRRLLAMGIVPLRREEVPHYTRILADSDMDGLFGAAVLKAFDPMPP